MRFFAEQGLDVIGLENDMRARFFGAEVSTAPRRALDYTLSERARIGDHRWWISDLQAFKADYPGWQLTYGIEDVLRDIYEHNAERWAAIAR